MLTSLAAGALSAAKFTRPLGVQLYTVRNEMPKTPRETLQGIAAAGYTEVEVLRASFAEIKPMLKDLKLKPVSAHFETPLITGGPGMPKGVDLASAAADAKASGLEYAICPYVMPADRGKTLDDFRKFADVLNQAGETCRKAGIGFAYHNHAFEFAPMEGKTPFEILMERLDPKLAQIELDVFWVSVAGHDPVKILTAHKGRIPLVHLKDRAPNFPVQYNENVPKDTFREVGSGSLDFPAILAAAEKGGVKHFIVEQDQTPGDPVASLKKSYQYLRSLA